MANAVRGEVGHVIAGRAWVFCPSFRAIMEIEAELGPVLPLAQKVAAGNFGFREVAVILWATAVGERPSLEDMGALVLQNGLADLAAPVRDLLTQILSGTGGGEGADAGKPNPPVG